MPLVPIATTVEEAMRKPGLLEAVIDRDARSRPESVIFLMALHEGGRVADVFSGSGHRRGLLTSMVGENGVVLQDNEAYTPFVSEEPGKYFAGRGLDTATRLGAAIPGKGARDAKSLHCTDEVCAVRRLSGQGFSLHRHA